jgi:hypothetical protein
LSHRGLRFAPQCKTAAGFTLPHIGDYYDSPERTRPKQVALVTRLFVLQAEIWRDLSLSTLAEAEIPVFIIQTDYLLNKDQQVALFFLNLFE